MKSQIISRSIAICSTLLFSLNTFAQSPPDIEWEKKHGGPYTDGFNSVAATNDGGFVATGIYNVGNFNYWIQKMDANGNAEWSKNYGGTNQDKAKSIFQTDEGGYVVGGTSGSNNGDVTDNHGMDDAWILKLNTLGEIIWKKSFGGSSYDGISKLLSLSDGNFLALGLTSSDDGDLAGINTVSFFGESNIWLIKLDTDGNIIWQKTYGGISHDAGYDIIAMPDGGFAIAGTEANAIGLESAYDVFVSRIDADGNELWKNTFGYDDYDRAYTLIATENNDIIIAGSTLSSTFPEFNGGGTDAIIAKLDGNTGNTIWHKAIGGSLSEWFTSITKYNDLYILAGTSSSTDGDISNNIGSWDIWLVAIDENGTIYWDKNFGASAEEAGSGYDVSIIPTTDNGLVIASMTGSNEIIGGGGSWDGYIFKLKDNSMNIDEHHLSNIYVYPNPTTDYLHILTNSTEKYHYKLIDVNGRILQSHLIETSEKSIDLQHLPTGTYFLQLQNGEIQLTKKIIKQ
jgi:hypothetical protein